jgi:hypothetical protein
MLIRNKMKTKKCVLLVLLYITMHGQQNIKLKLSNMTGLKQGCEHAYAVLSISLDLCYSVCGYIVLKYKCVDFFFRRRKCFPNWAYNTRIGRKAAAK